MLHAIGNNQYRIPANIDFKRKMNFNLSDFFRLIVPNMNITKKPVPVIKPGENAIDTMFPTI